LQTNVAFAQVAEVAQVADRGAAMLQKIDMMQTYFKGANIADMVKKNKLIAAVASTKTQMQTAIATITDKKALMSNQKNLMKSLTTQVKENLTKTEMKDFTNWRKANKGKR
jgi:hypothetical protein